MSVFSYSDYREFLHAELGEGKRTGQRQRLAEALGCQAAHLSQVLSGKNHLSVEHAFGVGKFFGFTENESEYFLNILQASRAGTTEAKSYFHKKAQEAKDKSLKILDRISSEKRVLSNEEQAIYYGDGLYALAHVATSLPHIRSLQDLAAILDVDLETTAKVVEFLMTTGLVAKKKDVLTTGPGYTHIGADSPHVKKHHLNLRLAGIRNIERGLKKNDVHYATYYTLSKDDAFLIKEKIVKFIDENVKIIGPSKEETLYCNIVDFFEITQK